jgi:cell division protein FtsX
MTPEASGMLRMARSYLPQPVVFFIACVNVATFLLSRSSTRSKETSVCIAIGASRGWLARQLFADAAVLSVSGGAVGMLLALDHARHSVVLARAGCWHQARG